MTRTDEYLTEGPWRALRLAAGLSQREVERRLGWKSGNLSWIERGAVSASQAQQLRELYGALLATAPKEGT
jgi:transcriptional regulator with XRE-family HTH domain